MRSDDSSPTSPATGVPAPSYRSGCRVIARTSCPASSRAGASRPPTNPDAPVTSTRTPPPSRPDRRCATPRCTTHRAGPPPQPHHRPMDSPGEERNVLGGPLEPCGTAPMNGFTREGSCSRGPEDLGSHTVCAVVSAEFLEFQRRLGNDLSTPRPEYD